MGSNTSVKVADKTSELPSSQRRDLTARVFKRIDLTDRELNKFHAAFESLSRSGGNEHGAVISDVEFCKYLMLPQTALARTLFDFFDVDRNGRLDYCEFTHGLWNYLTLSSECMPHFLYVMFTTVTQKSLDCSTSEKLVEVVCSNGVTGDHNVEVADIAKSAPFDEESFSTYCYNCPFICAPLNHLQTYLRRRIFGKYFWTKLTKKRARRSDLRRPEYTREMYNFMAGRPHICYDSVVPYESEHENCADENESEVKLVSDMVELPLPILKTSTISSLKMECHRRKKKTVTFAPVPLVLYIPKCIPPEGGFRDCRRSSHTDRSVKSFEQSVDKRRRAYCDAKEVAHQLLRKGSGRGKSIVYDAPIRGLTRGSPAPSPRGSQGPSPKISPVGSPCGSPISLTRKNTSKATQSSSYARCLDPGLHNSVKCQRPPRVALRQQVENIR